MTSGQIQNIDFPWKSMGIGSRKMIERRDCFDRNTFSNFPTNEKIGGGQG